jgi:hypothetical protein
MPDLSPSELDRIRNEVRQFIRGGDHNKWFISKTIRAESIPDSDRTAKAFTLFYLAGEYSEVGLDAATIVDATNDVRGALERQSEAMERVAPNNDVSVLPNSYASAVLVAGYLTVVNKNEAAPNGKTLERIELKTEEATCKGIRWMTDRIIKPDGFIPSWYVVKTPHKMPDDKPRPSSYLTFWCAAAVHQWQQYLKARNLSDNVTNSDSLRLLVSWSGRRLRDMLAFHHGGLRPQFDVIEVVYASATLLMASDNRDDRILVQCALRVLFKEYFDSGSLKGSAAVFTDETGLSVQISTAEALATIFLVDRKEDGNDSIMDEHLSHIHKTYEWLREQGNPDKGWSPEGQARADIPNAYATASATRLLLEYGSMLDNRLDRNLRADLGINPYVEEKRLKEVTYPGDLHLLLSQTVFDPIKRGDRGIASYSMVLYGPPGTSKTTIAELISRDLGWPLLKLGAGSFTHKGRAGIDQAVAEKFEALRYLKGVVVLFDEVEELVGNREDPQANIESRLLTTAMLPRLQELRKRQEIVFILATNRVENIDKAIIRRGRFDIVRCVLPPTPRERHRMLDKLIRAYTLPEDVKGYISNLQIAEESDGFCYGDLDDFVRELAIQAVGCPKEDLQPLIKRIFKHAQTRALTKDDLEPYAKSKDKYDRPSLRTA